MSKKAQAVQAQTPPPTHGSNQPDRQTQIDKMNAEIDELGEIEGKGGNSRATLGIRCVEWAADGTADTGDAFTIYDRYMRTVETAAAAFGGTKRKRQSADQGRKQNASKIRQFLKMGGLKIIDPVKVINNAAGVVKDARSKGLIAFGPYEALLNIAREQCANTQNELTDEEMIECNQPTERGDPEEADSLGAIVAKIDKHEERFGTSDETVEAGSQLRSRIEMLGGTTAQKKAKERAAEKEAKKNKIKRK
jgi:hypothetical protein